MRWSFRAGDQTFRAVRAVDTATHPDFQGQGVFRRLTLDALEELRADTDFVFNTPNEKSLPGYLKMGWREVGKVPIWIRVRHPLRLARGVRSIRTETAVGPQIPSFAPSATDALSDGSGVSSLLQESGRSGTRLTTDRTLSYLRWRYADAPLLDYRAVVEEGVDGLNGLAIFRVRPRGRLWESTIAEVLARPGDGSTARRLCRRIATAAPVDHLTCNLSTWSAGVAARSGFVRSPLGMTLVVNHLGGDLRPDPTDLRSWAFSLGDLEVF
jgi:hypothetical protein